MIIEKTVTISEAALIRMYSLQERPPAQTNHDYCDALTLLCYQNIKVQQLPTSQAMFPTSQKKRSSAVNVQECSSALKAPNQKPLEAREVLPWHLRVFVKFVRKLRNALPG